MDRFFRPKGGFANSPVDRIRIDDNGNTFKVLPDGTEQPDTIVHDKGRVARPVWNLTELQNLVKGGKWEEVTPEQKPAPTAPNTPAKRESKSAPLAPEPQAKQE